MVGKSERKKTLKLTPRFKFRNNINALKHPGKLSNIWDFNCEINIYNFLSNLLKVLLICPKSGLGSCTFYHMVCFLGRGSLTAKNPNYAAGTAVRDLNKSLKTGFFLCWNLLDIDLA